MRLTVCRCISSSSTVCWSRPAAIPTSPAAPWKDIAPSDITAYRLQCDSEDNLRSYIAEREILPVATRSFGGIAIFGIHEMGRFHRHVLGPEALLPHHGAVAFSHYGKILFEVLKFLGIQDIATAAKSLRTRPRSRLPDLA